MRCLPLHVESCAIRWRIEKVERGKYSVVNYWLLNEFKLWSEARFRRTLTLQIAITSLLETEPELENSVYKVPVNWLTTWTRWKCYHHRSSNVLEVAVLVELAENSQNSELKFKRDQGLLPHNIDPSTFTMLHMMVTRALKGKPYIGMRIPRWRPTLVTFSLAQVQLLRRSKVLHHCTRSVSECHGRPNHRLVSCHQVRPSSTESMCKGFLLFRHLSLCMCMCDHNHKPTNLSCRTDQAADRRNLDCIICLRELCTRPKLKEKEGKTDQDPRPRLRCNFSLCLWQI